jgi:hypothetical protein
MNESIEEVGAVDPDKETSPIVAQEPPASDEAGLRAICWFNGQQYGQGAKICSGHRLLYCSNGTWYDQGSC